ncbi:conserved hypothetical protein [Hyphomicrobiales bacterium]|nr:conserved hypothetical protein [Hyphomicrobiales bacterium]CAH1697706.1 conserved hypothetical protein [Hyphomicrobiales bacterium]CAI0347353.1 conserved hypothetical protein [Hyphomicrobiales bacterium]
MARSQSPGYPNFSLSKALGYARSIHSADRRNPIDREVAAKHMGYSGTSGASEKTLGSLAHYGLVERSGKGQMRITQLAVDILHPAPGADRKKALLEAAFHPNIFAEIRDRFADGTPSEGALKSWLTRESFLDRAIGPVVAAYLDTVRFLEQEKAFESNGPSGADDRESVDSNTSEPGVATKFGGARVGDLVQWESAGALQFQQPRRVRLVTDDGQWVAVEGSETGIPMSEVMVESAAPNSTPVFVAAAPTFPVPQTPPPNVGMSNEGFAEWFRAKVGPSKQVQISYRGEGDIGAVEIQKLINMLEAQKKALED